MRQEGGRVERDKLGSLFPKDGDCQREDGCFRLKFYYNSRRFPSGA